MTEDVVMRITICETDVLSHEMEYREAADGVSIPPRAFSVGINKFSVQTIGLVICLTVAGLLHLLTI